MLSGSSMRVNAEHENYYHRSREGRGMMFNGNNRRRRRRVIHVPNESLITIAVVTQIRIVRHRRLHSTIFGRTVEISCSLNLNLLGLAVALRATEMNCFKR